MLTLRHNFRWVISLSILFVLSCSYIVAGKLVAQQADSVTLTISPNIINVAANPGEAPIENVVKLTNGGDLPLEIETVPQNILPRGELGAVDLTEDQTSYSLAEWITVEPEAVTLAPQDTQEFKLTITVPENGEPGGHFGTVVFRTVPNAAPNSGAGASVSQEIAPVILVSVAGDIQESANIASFESAKSLWTNEKPIVFNTRIENTGNVHFAPTGTITIKNMFGGEVTQLPLESNTVLPSSIRLTESEWSEPGFAVGRYTADLSVVYGENDEILTASTTFTIFPWQTILPVAVVIILVLVVLIKFRNRLAAAGRALRGN